MSSGFVSAGTNEQPLERDDEWLKAQRELEEERRRKAEVGKQNDGKSLFEVLEQNKMAKQEAFEEKARLKNQFRSLDEDEVEFLDSVLESTRAQEAAVKRDTAAQLEVFRRQREEAEKAQLENTSPDVTSKNVQKWTISARKRRRNRERDTLIPGKKRKESLEATNSGKEAHEAQDLQELRKESRSNTNTTEATSCTSGQVASTAESPGSINTDPTTQPKVTTGGDSGSSKANIPVKPSHISLGLGGYSSDSE